MERSRANKLGEDSMKQWTEEHLGHTGWRWFAPLGMPSWEAAFTKIRFWGKRSWLSSFPFPSPQPPSGSRVVQQCLPHLTTPSPTINVLWCNCSSKSSVPQSQQGGSCLRRTADNPAYTTSPDQRVLQGLGSGGISVECHLISRPECT